MLSHPIPSGLVAALAEEVETATNKLLPNATPTHAAVAGKVRAFHEIPSAELAAIVPDVLLTATNVPLP